MRRPHADSKRRFPRLAAFGASALLATLAHAGRPLATEDADTLDKGACEWESHAARETASGLPSTVSWVTQAGCGFGWNSQVAVAIGRTRSDGASVNDFTLVGKTGLLVRSERSVGLTVAWTIAAAKSAGASLKHDSTSLALVATRSFADDVTGHANLVWIRSEIDRLSSTTWNLAVEWALPGGIDVMGETYGDDRGDPWLGSGVRYAVSEHLSIDASYSVQRGWPRTRLVTVGFKLSF